MSSRLGRRRVMHLAPIGPQMCQCLEGLVNDPSVCQPDLSHTDIVRLDADDSGHLNYNETLKGLKRLPIFKSAGIYLSPEDWELPRSVAVSHTCRGLPYPACLPCLLVP